MALEKKQRDPSTRKEAGKKEKKEPPKKTEAKAKKAPKAKAETKKAAKDESKKNAKAADKKDSKKAPAKAAAKNEAPKAKPAPILVRPSSRYLRIAPRKARLIADQVRGLQIDKARALLQFSPRGAAQDIGKLIESAADDPQSNFDL